MGVSMFLATSFDGRALLDIGRIKECMETYADSDSVKVFKRDDLGRLSLIAAKYRGVPVTRAAGLTGVCVRKIGG